MVPSVASIVSIFCILSAVELQVSWQQTACTAAHTLNISNTQPLNAVIYECQTSTFQLVEGTLVFTGYDAGGTKTQLTGWGDGVTIDAVTITPGASPLTWTILGNCDDLTASSTTQTNCKCKLVFLFFL